MEEEILDIKRENYKLRKENFELIQDNTKLQEEINLLNYKLKEKICMEANSQFRELKEDLKEVLNQTYYNTGLIFTEIREKYNLDKK
jgi:hypothetical protein